MTRGRSAEGGSGLEVWTRVVVGGGAKEGGRERRAGFIGYRSNENIQPHYTATTFEFPTHPPALPPWESKGPNEQGPSYDPIFYLSRFRILLCFV